MVVKLEDIKSVETMCPDCGLSVGHLGDCLIGGIQAREIDRLKNKLNEAETLLFDIQDIDLYPLSQTLVNKILKIREYFDPKNPADNPDNCLACMGATGSAVKHTCKRD